MDPNENKYHHFAPYVLQIMKVAGLDEKHHSKGIISSLLVDAFEQGKKFQSEQIRRLIGAASEDDI